MGNNRNWTQAEIDYLEEKWGTVSVPHIAEELGRSDTAVVKKAQKLNLCAWYESGDYISVNQVFLALFGHKVYSYNSISWFQNRGFPVQYRKMRNDTVKVVNLDDFWKWAEENKQFLDFSRFEEYDLGKEPSWVKQKRREDVERRYKVKTTPWTPLDDEMLRSLLRKNKYTCMELSAKLRRTEGAIIRRISELKLKERPVKMSKNNPWTQEQLDTLGRMIKQGSKYTAIHEQIPDKSCKAIQGLVYRYYLTEDLCKVRKLIGDGVFGDNLPERQLKHMNYMTPEERNAAKDEVCKLAYLLLQHARNISPVSEEFKDYWQKDMCTHWSDITGCEAGETSCDSCTSFCRIREQYCVRCGGSFLNRKKSQLCDACKVARIKQAQKKWAVLNAKKSRKTT